ANPDRSCLTVVRVGKGVKTGPVELKWIIRHPGQPARSAWKMHAVCDYSKLSVVERRSFSLCERRQRGVSKE
ncbi:MAG: hypothetical protein ACREFR_16715, partial [Limisphaerales bacterium]